MLKQEGHCGPETQRPRHVLSLSTRQGRDHSSKLAGIELLDITQEADPTQRFATALWHARNAWDIARRVNGLGGGDHRIGKAEAERRLRRALAALAAGGGE
jgi:hypothetical protein